MKIFAKIEESFQLLTIFAKSWILEVWLDSKYVFLSNQKVLENSINFYKVCIETILSFLVSVDKKSLTECFY